MDLNYCIVDFEKKSCLRGEASRKLVLELILPLDEICISLGGHASRAMKFDDGPYDKKSDAISRFIVGPCTVRNEVCSYHHYRETHIEYCQSCCKEDSMKRIVEELIYSFVQKYGKEHMRTKNITCQIPTLSSPRL